MMIIKHSQTFRTMLLCCALATATYMILQLSYGSNQVADLTSPSEIDRIQLPDSHNSVLVSTNSDYAPVSDFWSHESDLKTQDVELEMENEVSNFEMSRQPSIPGRSMRLATRVSNPYFDGEMNSTPLADFNESQNLQERTANDQAQSSTNADHLDQTVELHIRFKASISPAERDQLVQQVQDAYALSQQGQTRAAQQRLFSIIHTTASRKDRAIGTSQFVEQVAVAFQALKDLRTIQVFEGSDQDLAILVSTQSTAVLHDNSQRTKQEIVTQYQNFAAQQLAEVGKSLEFASMAYCFLGKIHAEQEQSKGPDGIAAVFLQAALLADENNYWAANEYGVYLAETGDIENAGRLFAISNEIKANPQAAQNLAAISAQLLQQRNQIGNGSLRTALQNVLAPNDSADSNPIR